jgi:hypothetical protein
MGLSASLGLSYTFFLILKDGIAEIPTIRVMEPNFVILICEFAFCVCSSVILAYNFHRQTKPDEPG